MGTIGALYFMLPAYMANLLPPLLTRFKILDSPMDFGARVRGKRVFGNHKTWRGFIFGTLAGTMVFWIQQQSTPFGWTFSLVDYHNMTLWLGLLLSAGALIGDAVKSFIKRQVGIKPGHPWPVFDQIDYVIGALLLASMVFLPSVEDIMIIIGWSLILTITVKHIGYYIGINKVAW